MTKRHKYQLFRAPKHKDNHEIMTYNYNFSQSLPSESSQFISMFILFSLNFLIRIDVNVLNVIK